MDCAEEVEIALLEQKLLGVELFEKLEAERKVIREKHTGERLRLHQEKWAYYNNLLCTGRKTWILPSHD